MTRSASDGSDDDWHADAVVPASARNASAPLEIAPGDDPAGLCERGLSGRVGAHTQRLAERRDLLRKVGIVFAYMAVGVVFYSLVLPESFSFVDSLYFSTMTFTTVRAGRALRRRYDELQCQVLVGAALRASGTDGSRKIFVGKMARNPGTLGRTAACGVEAVFCAEAIWRRRGTLPCGATHARVLCAQERIGRKKVLLFLLQGERRERGSFNALFPQ